MPLPRSSLVKPRHDLKLSRGGVYRRGGRPRDSYSKVRAGEWAEGRIVGFGFLKRVRGRRTSMVGPVLESGSRLIGAVRVNARVEIDFGFFRSELAFASEEERRKILK